MWNDYFKRQYHFFKDSIDNKRTGQNKTDNSTSFVINSKFILPCSLTHWKQNLFLLDDPVEVRAADVVSGTFRLYRHEEWRRHVRVHIAFTIKRDSIDIVSITHK